MFEVGDIVLFAVKVRGDSYDNKTKLYIPSFFENMVGKEYIVESVNDWDDCDTITLRDIYGYHIGTKYENEISSCLYCSYWFQPVSSQIEDASDVDFLEVGYEN